MTKEKNSTIEERVATVKLRLRSVFLLAVGFLTLTLLYSNCSAQHGGANMSSASSASIAAANCSLTGAQQLFQLTYYPFLQTNCSSCHSATGEAAGTPFGDSNIVSAYSSFMSETAQGTDLTKINNYAVGEPDMIHVPPAAGPQFATQINDLGATQQSQWQVGINELKGCGNTQFLGDQYQATRTWLISKPIGFSAPSQIGTAFENVGPCTDTNNAAGCSQTVDWDLSQLSEVARTPVGTCASTSNAQGCWPNLPGAHFEIDLQAFATGDESEYIIRNPRIVYPSPNSNAVNFTAHSIQVKIDGQVVVNETTFQYVAGAVYKSLATNYLSVGAMADLSNIRKSDVISVSFGDIDTTTALPPIPAPPTVTLSLASDSLTKPNGLASPVVKQVKLQLSNPSNLFVNVPINIGADIAAGDAVPPTLTMAVPGTDNGNGKPIQIPSFLIDYQITGDTVAPFTGPVLDSNTSNQVDAMVTILPGMTSTTLNISVIPNDRYENNGQGTHVRLAIDSNQNGNQLGTLSTGITVANANYNLSIANSSTQPAANAVTLTQLLSPGGAFYDNCIECHYPNPNASPPFSQPLNNYSMTVYSSLMSANHFVPNNTNASVAWQLINGSTPQMPLNGLLPQGSNYYLQIYNWIMAGAKND